MKEDRLLTGSVGHGGDNKPDDVFLLRNLLPIAARKELPSTKTNPDEGGQVDSNFVEEIGGFQEENGLHVDGLVNSGGETERNIINQIVNDGRPVDDVGDFSLNASVGEGGVNDPTDVAKTRLLLAAAGEHPVDTSSALPKFIDSNVVHSIRFHQEKKNIPPDGLIDPDGLTFQSLEEAANEQVPQKSRNKEIQVAALPFLIPILLQAARTAAPHIIRSLPGLAAAVHTQKAIEGTLPKNSERTDIADPPLAVMPGGPIEPPDPDRDREEFPVDPPEPKVEIFPALDPNGPWVEILPDQSGELPQISIVENRGSEPIRQLNTKIRGWVEKYVAISKLGIKHIAGARVTDPKTGKVIELKELFLPNPETGRKGSTFPDISFESEKTGRKLHINTVDTKARGTFASKREQDAATRMLVNKADGDIVLLIAKPGFEKTLSEESFGETIIPLLKELDEVFNPENDNLLRYMKPLQSPPSP